MNQLFKFCPKCGRETLEADQTNVIQCSSCRFYFYRNPTAAVAGVIANSEGQVLLIRRAKDPSRGKLAFPGGFIDIDETAESALQREIREEVSLTVTSFSFLTSHPNHYHYREIIYPVLDLFFVCQTDTSLPSIQKDEVESIQWIRPDEVKTESLAFDSMKHAWHCYIAHHKTKK